MSTAHDPADAAHISTRQAAERWFGKALAEASDVEKRVMEIALRQKTVAKDASIHAEAGRTFGERMADAVAAFGGSWVFISLFALTILLWSLINTEVLGPGAFDPYPYIFLNLMLSMLAAVQAPVILMSQNRQAGRDRIAAALDYEVNLRAELGVIALHEKLEIIRTQQMASVIAAQQEQIELLRQLLDRRDSAPPQT